HQPDHALEAHDEDERIAPEPCRRWSGLDRYRGLRNAHRFLRHAAAPVTPVAAFHSAVSSMSPANAATLQPPRMTMTRSHRPTSSGSSLEATRTPRPSLARPRSR